MAKHIDFSEHVLSVFAEMKTDYEAMTNLMTDLACHKALYDEEAGREISAAEANAKILEFSRKVMKINDIRDRKAVRRAVRDNGRAFYDIIEDTLDVTVKTGLEQNEWFNILVEQKSIKYGDRQDFIAEEDGVLAVAKVGESHHDHILQRLVSGQRYSIPTARYAIKIGADINKFILGEVAWDKMVEAVTKAFILKIQEEVYAEVRKAVDSLPANQFKATGALGEATKAAFDNILSNVASVNGSEVVILGTKNALRNLNNLAKVEWIADSQKEAVAKTGILGDYEGTTLVEIPQRLSLTSGAKVVPVNKLYILPMTEDKPVKFVDEGESEIYEVTEKGDLQDDFETYELSRRMGVEVVLGQYFGVWSNP